MNEVQKTAARITLLNAVALAQLAYDGARMVGASDQDERKAALREAKAQLKLFDIIF